MSAHVGDVVETVAVAGAELCATYLVKLVEVAFRYLCTQIEVLVLGDYGKGLTSFHIVAAIDHTLLDVAAAGSCYSHAAGAACALHAGVGELGSLIFRLGNGEVFLAYYLVLDECFRTCIVALGTLVVDTCTLNGVAVSHLHSCGSDGEERGSGSHLQSFTHVVLILHSSADGGNNGSLVA